jgi:hypothetical protein
MQTKLNSCRHPVWYLVEIISVLGMRNIRTSIWSHSEHEVRFVPSNHSKDSNNETLCAPCSNVHNDHIFLSLYIYVDRLYGLVFRVPGYRSRGSGFDYRRYQIFWEVVGLERGPLSLMSITEELLERKSSGSGSRKPRLMAVGTSCAEHATPSIG